jgi:short subunit dehydrogenase-like uncharacterized protein
MVQRGKCVINCAGPYTLHGEPVVRACIEHSVQYCDINGEPWWMKEMIEKYHQRAKEKKVAIVFACGFDSIPSDVGSFVLAQHIKETTGEDVRRIEAVFRMAGGFSGGSLQTGLIAEQHKDVAADVFSLGGRNRLRSSATGSSQIRDEDKDVTEAGYNTVLQTHTAPFMMATINTRVVRRTTELIDSVRSSYPSLPFADPSFSYNEFLGADTREKAVKLTRPPLPPGTYLSLSLSLSLFICIFSLIRFVDVCVEMIKKMIEDGMLPKPGEGPSREQLSKGKFSTELVAESSVSRRIFVLKVIFSFILLIFDCFRSIY